MTTHTIGLYLHYLGLVGLFVGYGLEWTGSSLLRRATSTEQARTALGIYRLSMPLSGPGLLVLILSGGYLASITGDMKQAWISATFLAIVLALGMGFVLILPRVRTIRAALPEGTLARPETALAGVKARITAPLIGVPLVLARGIFSLMPANPASL